MERKFIIACLDKVEDEKELTYIWDYLASNTTFTEKTDLLKEVMGGDDVKYFDIPSEPEAEYECIKAIFLSFNWRYAQALRNSR